MLGTVLVIFLSFLLLLWWRSRPRNPPPSPGLALPIVGHMYLFKENPTDQIETWRKRLGNIYTIQMGTFRCVMLNGYDLISEILLKHHESLLGRPDMFLHKEIFEYAGIVSLGGNKWKEQRSFLQSTLRALGMGRNIMAERIQGEADYLLTTIDAAQSQALEISNLVTVCVTNVLCGVIFSKRFNQGDETILQWLKSVSRLFEVLGSSAALNFFPFLKYMPGDMFKFNEVKSIIKNLKETIWGWVDKDHRVINLSDQGFDDVSHAFLTEIERKKRDAIASTTIDEANMLASMLALFNAGIETTVNTIIFAVLYMVNFPHLQDQLFREIEDVVGLDRSPSISDKSNLKLLSAFIMETQRFANVVPLGQHRLATKDIHLGGYTISQGTSVIVNFDSILRDESVWGDPDIFRPDRFLDADGSVIVKKELIPFGIGRRNCVGEALASMELFLFLAALVQKFEFLPEKDGELPTMVPNVRFTSVAQPFKVRAISRPK
ncbi:cytochrome p450 2j2 [Plakobranchus ocellatus]|uniref:Cytochrome p450 2j2 n=1 Tax=Plakobranchus ocellatus TaxID=259542 RepID=A0AAV3Z9M3_9GAST|nr:cytochrome p450 2j2 [Plakobranchus ocellatus]